MKGSALLLVIIVLLGNDGRPALADQGFYGGMACLPTDEAGGSGTSSLVRGALLGMYIYSANTSTAQGVLCPVYIGSGTIDPTGARVDTYDTSSVDDVACNVYIQDDGSVTALGTLYTCGTAGGCGSPTVSWSGGVGYLSWGDTVGSISGELHVVIGCGIGRTDSFEIMKIDGYELTY